MRKDKYEMRLNIDDFYLKQIEPYRSVFLTLRNVILSLDPNVSDELKYGMPFFCYKKKMFCYFWIERKSKESYIGLVEGGRID